MEIAKKNLTLDKSDKIRRQGKGMRFIKALVLLFVLVVIYQTYRFTIRPYLPPWAQVHFNPAQYAVTMGYRETDREATFLASLLSALNNLSRPASEIPTLTLDVKFKHMEKIRVMRSKALSTHIPKKSKQPVPAKIRFNGRNVKVKIRLKGDRLDHIQHKNKWSFRIKVKGKKQILGMREFSIQHPITRGYHTEKFYIEFLRELGLLTPRYFFANVILNGDDLGIMAIEEHFSKEMLESQGRRDSVMIKYDENLMFADIAATGTFGFFNNFKNNKIEAFNQKYIRKSNNLRNYHKIAVGLLRGWIAGELQASQVFNVEQLGKHFVAAGIFRVWHNTNFHNLRFYYNPITSRLEPIVFDSQITHLSNHKDIRFVGGVIRMEDLINDPLVFKEIKNQSAILVEKFKEGNLLEKLQGIENRQLAILSREFPLLTKYPWKVLSEQLEYAESLIINNWAILKEDEIKKQADLVKIIEGIEKNPDTFPQIIHAYIIKGAKGPYLELTPAVPYKIKIKSIQWVSKRNNHQLKFNPVTHFEFPIALPKGNLDLPKFERFDFLPPENMENYDLKITAFIHDGSRDYSLNASPYFAPLTKNPIPESTLEKELARHEFLEDNQKPGLMRVRPGKWNVRGDLIVPEGYTLGIPAGTTLRFQPDGSLISRGALVFEGTRESPVVLQGKSPDSADSWLGVVVLNAREKSRWKHVSIMNTKNMDKDGWVLTGGVNFYQSDVEMNQVSFADSRGEDALNIIRSTFLLRNTNFRNTHSDAFDSDFSDGIVENGVYENIGAAGGGDAIDTSGSRTTVHKTVFIGVNDKALSVGEKSTMKATGVQIRQSGTAAASKDGSLLFISNSDIGGMTHAGLVTYIKKPEYGPAKIIADNIRFTGKFKQVWAQKENELLLNGRAIETEDIDVEQLYDTIMKKGA